MSKYSIIAIIISYLDSGNDNCLCIVKDVFSDLKGLFTHFKYETSFSCLIKRKILYERSISIKNVSFVETRKNVIYSKLVNNPFKDLPHTRFLIIHNANDKVYLSPTFHNRHLGMSSPLTAHLCLHSTLTGRW